MSLKFKMKIKVELINILIARRQKNNLLDIDWLLAHRGLLTSEVVIFNPK